MLFLSIISGSSQKHSENVFQAVEFAPVDNNLDGYEIIDQWA